VCEVDSRGELGQYSEVEREDGGHTPQVHDLPVEISVRVTFMRRNACPGSL
jgi:hypothetical protein